MSLRESFTAVVVSHENETGLRKMLGNLMYQTRKPDEVYVLVSGLTPAAVAELREDHPHTTFLVREDRQDAGHEKRAEGLRLASGDWIGWFNDDDWYDDHFIEKMMKAARGSDGAWCAWSANPNPAFKLGSSTSGNFIVRTKLAQEVGYPEQRTKDGRLVYETDGIFIDALNKAGTFTFVPEVLYSHNWQPKG